MGVDLKLLELTTYGAGGSGYAHTMLAMDRRRELWGPIVEIEKAGGRDVPEGFTSYLHRPEGGECKACGMSTGYGVITEDSYGDRVKSVLAADLVAKIKPDAEWTPRNRAIWAYLGALPEGTRIVLYWH